MNKLRLAIILIFLAGLTILVVAFNTTKPRLLILQSYDKEYAWTRDVDVGIRRILNHRNEYATRWFYMDTKRHPWPDYKANTGLAVRKLIDSWQPSVVIAVDDDAQQFAMRHFVGHPEVKVVFAGVNEEAAAYGYDKAGNVTGILERLPLAALKETLLEMARMKNLDRPPRVMFLGDLSETVVADERYFSRFDWAPLVRVDSKLVDTFDAWQESIRTAEGQVDFIVVSNYRKILRKKGEQALVPPKELIEWSEQNSTPPIIGTNLFYAQDGGMLAIGTSPFEQGEVAATQARELLDDPRKSTHDVPLQVTRQFVVSMRASRLAARNFKLPSIYEAAARSANNYYK